MLGPVQATHGAAGARPGRGLAAPAPFRRGRLTLFCRRSVDRVGGQKVNSVAPTGASRPAFNVVRFRVKPEHEQEFVDVHRDSPHLPGMIRFAVVKGSDRRYFVVGKWESMEALGAARAGMIGMLDRFRHCLEDLGNGMGVTAPISGESVLTLE